MKLSYKDRYEGKEYYHVSIGVKVVAFLIEIVLVGSVVFFLYSYLFTKYSGG